MVKAIRFIQQGASISPFKVPVPANSHFDLLVYQVLKQKDNLPFSTSVTDSWSLK